MEALTDPGGFQSLFIGIRPENKKSGRSDRTLPSKVMECLNSYHITEITAEVELVRSRAAQDFPNILTPPSKVKKKMMPERRTGRGPPVRLVRTAC